MIMLQDLIKNLNSQQSTIYERIHEKEQYSMSKNIVKKTCRCYSDVYYYSSSLVFRNIKENDINVIEYRFLIDIITIELNNYLLYF